MNRLCNLILSAGRISVLSTLALFILRSSAVAAQPLIILPVLTPGTTLYNSAISPPNAFFTPFYTNSTVPAGSLSSQYSLVVTHSFPYNYDGQIDGSFFGTVTSNVYLKNDGSGQLAFSYVFDNLVPPASALNGFNPNPPMTDIVRATMNDPSNPWSGFSIFSAGADASGSSANLSANSPPFGSWTNGNPFDIQRDFASNGSGIQINFNTSNSGTQLNSTSSTTDVSATIWVTTDATRYSTTNVAFSDNGHVGSAQAYAPKVNGTLPTPEPSTLVLSAIGCLGGAITLWRRRRKCIAG